MQGYLRLQGICDEVIMTYFSEALLSGSVLVFVCACIRHCACVGVRMDLCASGCVSECVSDLRVCVRLCACVFVSVS